MGILNIAPATRAGMRFIISLYGMSETGKTLSALKLAAGLEPDPTKRGLLDTEGGQRGRAYVDHIPGGYMYASLSAPFTPERYIEALGEFEAAGINVLTIDSVSHAWFAEGGILDMVEAATERNDMAKWAKPKRRLAKMTRRILSGDMHIILCSRGKQPMVEQEVNGRKTYVQGPVIPIQEKSLRFDMTIMAQMLGDGKFTVAAPAGKCPGALRPIFAAGEVMDEGMGKKLADWIKGESVKTPAQRQMEIAASDAAEEGTEAFRAYWKGLTAEARLYLKPNLDNYKSMAQAVDDDAAAKSDAPPAADEDPFGSGEPAPIQKPALVTETLTLPALPSEESGERSAWGKRIIAEIKAADATRIALYPDAIAAVEGLPDVLADMLAKAVKARGAELAG